MFHAASLNYRDNVIVEVGAHLRGRSYLCDWACGDPQLRVVILLRSARASYRDQTAGGTVGATGPRVSRFHVGDRVATLFNQGHLSGSLTPASLRTSLGGMIDGTLAQHAVFNEKGLVKAPSNVDWLECSPWLEASDAR